MLKTIKIVLCIALLGFLGTASADQLDTELQGAIQNYLNQNQGSLGISAVVLSIYLPSGENRQRDYVVGSQYYDQPTPATTNMMLQWGSITKEYTDVLIFQLINAGKLHLSDTLIQLLPEKFTTDNSNSWPIQWANVTLTELMNMTSGVTDFTSIPNFLPMPVGQYSLDDIVNLTALQ